MAPADPAALAAVSGGPSDPAGVLELGAMDRLLDPAPLPVENGWWRRSNGTQQVAARTPMPGVTGEMIDWWFSWHGEDGLRYRIWHPGAHRDTHVEAPAAAGLKPFWGAIHHPVEDVGTGTLPVQIAFLPPSELGFADDVLDDPRVATVVCGYVGDGRHRSWHSVMAHVFLRADDGLVLRSRFWLGARIRPMLPAAVGAPIGWLASRPSLRRRIVPVDLAPSLARHCLEEYANLAAILPGLYAEHAGDGSSEA